MRYAPPTVNSPETFRLQDVLWHRTRHDPSCTDHRRPFALVTLGWVRSMIVVQPSIFLGLWWWVAIGRATYRHFHSECLNRSCRLSKCSCARGWAQIERRVLFVGSLRWNEFAMCTTLLRRACLFFLAHRTPTETNLKNRRCFWKHGRRNRGGDFCLGEGCCAVNVKDKSQCVMVVQQMARWPFPLRNNRWQKQRARVNVGNYQVTGLYLRHAFRSARNLSAAMPDIVVAVRLATA